MLSNNFHNVAEAAKQAIELSANDGGNLQTPEGFALFTAEFGRDGADLILEGVDGTVLRLSDYFNGDTPPDILSHDGASLAGRVVERLAGPLFPGQYAQVSGFDLTQAIGQIEAISGAAFVQRTDGTVETLEIGIKVFQGDVVRTEKGSTLGLTFADGTIFTFAEGSRMVLDELIYDPNANDNKGVFNLVQGGFVFIAGQVASTGGIEINTPAATMGIRGTTVKVDIQTRDGVSTVTVSLNPDPNGDTGAIELRDLNGNLIANVTQTDTKWIIEPPGTGVPPIEVERTDVDFAQDSPLLTQAVAAFQSALNRVQQGETFVELSDGNNIQGEQEVEDSEGYQPPAVVPPLDENGDDGGTGESGRGTLELDGEGEPLPEYDAGSGNDDDAFLDDGQPTTPAGSGGESNPVVTVTFIRSLEDTPLAGNLGVISASNGTQVSLTQGAQNGQVVLLSDGTFTYTPNADFEGTDNFTVMATGPNGTSTVREITVLVDPVNDAPVVASQLNFGSTFEIGTDSEGGSIPALGTVTYSDVDQGTVPGTWSISAAPQNTTALGTISINPVTGVWQYDLDQRAADRLAEGQQVVETYLATITDAEGASDTSTVQVAITGSNDGPVITSSAAQTALGEDVFGFTTAVLESVVESEAEPSETLATGSVSGSLAFFDVDQGETPGQWSVAPLDENQTSFGSATIDAISGEWIYNLDQFAADVLGTGEQATEVYIATVTDEFGATASQSITITIVGFNDAPKIEFSIEDITGTVIEEGYQPPDPEPEPVFQFARFAFMTLADASATGTLSYTDPDALPGAQATWAVAPLDASLGTMVIDEITGQWRYFLDETAAKPLSEGEERTETFTATVTDAEGGSSSQVITITVVGSNDEGEIIALPEDLAGAVEEGGELIAQGQLTFVDADAAPGEVSTWSISADGPSRGTMVIDTLTGAWTYSLDEALANSMGEGDQVVEAYTAALTDPLGAVALQTIEITITGENDGPIITSARLDGTVREAGATDPGISSISGTLTAVDPDKDGTNLNWQITPEAGNETALGFMSIDGSSGEWTYLLNDLAADGLALGQTVTERFAATAIDAFGASQSTTVEITIQGSADSPVLSSDSRTLSEDVAEIRIDLAALASDVDDGQDGSTLTYTLLNFPADGQARIEGTELVFETAGDFNSLIEGQTAVVVLNLQATDADGLSATSSISLTVIGANGAPVFSDASVTLVEDTVPTLSLNLATLADDPDAGEDGTTLTYSIVNAPAEGQATIVGTVLTFDPGTDFEDLAEGDSRAVSVDLQATDADGETATATVTVTVEGANDGPQISAISQTSGSVIEPGTPEPASPVEVSGQLFYSDPDEGSVSGNWTITPAATALGAMAIGPISGQWTYSLNQAAADSLNAGEVRNETFPATVTDAHGATASQLVQITITGTNDAPILEAESRLIEGEQGSATFDLEALASDVDSADLEGTLTFSILTAPAKGTATLDPAGRILTYSTGSDFDDLAEGQTATTTITVAVSDSNGTSTTADLTVTLTGTNDAPILTSGPASAQGTVVEPGFENSSSLTATGQLTYSDVDEGTTTGIWTVTPSDTGTYGTIAIDAASGQWTYTLDPASADALDEGEVVTETYEATYTDAIGATTAPQILTITIEGSNDAPVMTAGALTVNEDTAGTIDLTLFTTDPDASDVPANVTFTLTVPAPKGTASILDGTLTFFPAGDFDDLAVDDSEEVVLDLTLSDPAGGTSTSTVTITVTGTNDGPVITSGLADASGTAVESGEGPATPAIIAADATGQLSYLDPDETPDTLGSWSVDAIGPSYGTMNIDAETGAWSYFLSPTLSDSLREGETVEDRWTAVITDAEEAQAMEVITITITGTNDAPVIDDVTSVADQSHTEGGPTTLTGQLVARDPDTFVEPPVWTITRIDSGDEEAPVYGSMVISANGLWTYTVDPVVVDTLADGETAMETFSATVHDEFGQNDEVTVKVQFVGTNSAPELICHIP
jgi:VCBS repeat-containing protein